MNRENKRKQYEKGYYQVNPCSDSFVCKVCGRLMTPEKAETRHRNHCSNCLCSLHVDDEPGDRASESPQLRASTSPKMQSRFRALCIFFAPLPGKI